ncbi:archaeal proteasome endopeptidase complex subunit alpha [Candidatus Pacearchaeota archaeon]|nr:archaeal proteasome endopeptidase complex subunit alpha [Candidatus Pacearchaeota archaeon]
MDMPTEMQHQAMGYDRAATMFSPEGHLLQVEYAEKTVKLGSNSVGIVCKDGVIIVADKRIRDNLIAPESAMKVFEVDEHVMATAAGIASDARILVDRARLLSQQHRVSYGTPIDPISVIQMIADNKQAYTQYGGSRPYGVAIMIAGVSKGRGHLYTSDITGNFFAYKANSIGENDEQVKEELRKAVNENMTMDEGVKFVMKIFKDLLGKNFEISRFDVGMISLKDGKLMRLHGEELRKFVK